MKIVNAKKIMGAAMAALLVGGFVSCAQENAANYGVSNINGTTEIKGLAKATAEGIDFTAAVDGDTIKEKASGIYFTKGSAVATQATLYPFTESGKVYEFSVIKNFGTATEYESASFKILATGGAGEFAWAKKDAFDFKVQAEKDKDITVIAANEYKPGETDYWSYKSKAFNDTVDSASVTLKYARADRITKDGGWTDNNSADVGSLIFYKASNVESSYVYKHAEVKNRYASVIANVPVLQDQKAGSATVVTTATANNDTYWDLVGNDFLIRKIVKVSAKGNANNAVYTVQDEVTKVAKFGDRIEVLVGYKPAAIATSYNTAYKLTSGDLNDVITGNVIETKAINDGKLKTRYKFTGWNPTVNTYKVPTAGDGYIQNYVPNATKVYYGDVVPEPSVKPTLTYTYFKGETDIYNTTASETKTFSDDKTVNYALSGVAGTFTARSNDGVTAVKYDGKIYFTVIKTLSFSDRNERLSNY